jgi:glucose/arabinose dehydrogenase
MRHADVAARDRRMTCDAAGRRRGDVRRVVCWLLLFPLACCAKDGGAPGGPAALTLTLSVYARGLTKPIGVYNAGAGDPRLFVIEQPGRIRIVQHDGSVLLLPFLNLTDRVESSGSEEGLLGMAFHPDYGKTGFFYVNYTTSAGGVLRTRISQFSVTTDPNVADPTSEKILFTVDQPFSNHNGGDLHFGPDGLLYIPLGDGGAEGDPRNNAQTTTSLLGKITRIDVDSGAGAPPDCVGEGTGGYTIPPNPMIDGPDNACDEIWAMGLRNPWRLSFDRLSGDLYLADVGEAKWEEIDRHAVNHPGGQNYGWRCYEGTHVYNAGGCRSSDAYVAPIFEYGHDGGNCAVIGGYVYRGVADPKMAGRYLLADYCSGNFWDLARDGRGSWRATKHTNLALPGPVAGYTSFGEDAAGELYVTNIMNGNLYRLQGG